MKKTRPLFLLPLWEKMARTKSVPDEGLSAEEPLPFAALRGVDPPQEQLAGLLHKGRGEGCYDGRAYKKAPVETGA